MIKYLACIYSFCLAIGALANPQEELNRWIDSSFDANRIDWEKSHKQFIVYTSHYYKESENITAFLKLFNPKKPDKGDKSFKNRQSLNYPHLYKLADKSETLFPALENKLLDLIFAYKLTENQNMYTYLWIYLNHLNYVPLNDTRPNEMAYQLLRLKSFMLDDPQLFENLAVMILSRKILKQNDYVSSTDLVKKLYPSEKVEYTTETKWEEDYIDTEVDTTAIEPAFIGGAKNMSEFIVLNVNYPEEAKMMGEKGIVYGKFVVDQDGSVTQVSIRKGVTYSLDQEASRVLKIMPKWVPGSQMNKPVRVNYTIPLHFRLG